MHLIKAKFLNPVLSGNQERCSGLVDLLVVGSSPGGRSRSWQQQQQLPFKLEIRDLVSPQLQRSNLSKKF